MTIRVPKDYDEDLDYYMHPQSGDVMSGDDWRADGFDPLENDMMPVMLRDDEWVEWESN